MPNKLEHVIETLRAGAREYSESSELERIITALRMTAKDDSDAEHHLRVAETVQSEIEAIRNAARKSLRTSACASSSRPNTAGAGPWCKTKNLSMSAPR